jgi:hypothetical protein
LNLKLECTLWNLFFLLAGYFQESTSLEVSFVSFCLFIYTRNDVWAISSLLLQGLWETDWFQQVLCEFFSSLICSLIFGAWDMRQIFQIDITNIATLRDSACLHNSLCCYLLPFFNEKFTQLRNTCLLSGGLFLWSITVWIFFFILS